MKDTAVEELLVALLRLWESDDQHFGQEIHPMSNNWSGADNWPSLCFYTAQIMKSDGIRPNSKMSRATQIFDQKPAKTVQCVSGLKLPPTHLGDYIYEGL